MSVAPMLPRRAVLIGALAPLAGIPPAPAAATSPAILKLRRLVARAKAAVARECDLEGQPGYAEACAKAAALEAEVTARAASIWRTPATTWADVIARAEIADNWAAYDDRGRLWDLTAEYIGDRAAAELLQAVLVMGGRHV